MPDILTADENAHYWEHGYVLSAHHLFADLMQALGQGVERGLSIDTGSVQ